MLIMLFNTVNALLFARDYLANFEAIIKSQKINTTKRNTLVPGKLTRPELTTNINPR